MSFSKSMSVEDDIFICSVFDLPRLFCFFTAGMPMTIFPASLRSYLADLRQPWEILKRQTALAYGHDFISAQQSSISTDQQNFMHHGTVQAKQQTKMIQHHLQKLRHQLMVSTLTIVLVIFCTKNHMYTSNTNLARQSSSTPCP